MAAQVSDVGRNGHAHVRTEARQYDLDALARMNVDELGRLYGTGAPPKNVDALAGHPRGRMLAVKTLDKGFVFRSISKLSSASFFPWGGKSFSGRGERGEGINRVHLGGRHQLFPFKTLVGASVVDGKPCVILDYDLPDNPGFIRSIHDEVREVSPGLYLGPAMWKTKRGPAFVLWFALDTRIQATPIGSR